MKAVVVFSGGLDSATALYEVLSRGFDASTITFDYGQLARKEIECAREISKRLGLKWLLIDLSSVRKVYAGTTSLVDKNIPITKKFTQSLIVPFRNGIMLALAVAYAESIGAAHIFYGAQGSDASNYPDCRMDFVDAFQKAAGLGTGSNIIIEAPLINMKKSEVLKLGAKLGVPFELTWSCYRKGEKHCGVCESCVNRKKAFEEAGIIDKVEYRKSSPVV